MLKVNEYFEGKVKSIAVDNSTGKATAGVIAPGEFEFGTSTVEYMTVTYGQMEVLLPNASDWKLYNQNETFKVEKGEAFKVKVAEPVSYICRYE
ncbi:pyrimidine/purine nucleoside phosphorylase [Plebeiibacterium marinum]|uniref:Pyrimidine/purine nucleoside phosphorylase n=1 Tax=Plebeiibacterium marinum TaxID=2992111 RepID=A0AAE3MHE7_9BACT|nr:pyrimidine/purine nucleoside phosphorylase [Plebeiobacterium marinum]MCW3807107.1 pyrimidine/purine nucleoside phosphorylase [Plebeiobacterium marinum]